MASHVLGALLFGVVVRGPSLHCTWESAGTPLLGSPIQRPPALAGPTCNDPPVRAHPPWPPLPENSGCVSGKTAAVLQGPWQPGVSLLSLAQF